MDKDPANINKPLERNSEPPRRVLKEDAVGDKISKLRDEGKPQDQAVAIAKSMAERGELSEEELDLENIIKEETEKLLKENPDMFRGGPESHSSIGPHEHAPGAKVDTPEFREEFPDWAYMTPSGEFEKPLPNVVDLQRQALVDHEYGQLLKKYPLELFKGDKEMQKT